MNEIRLVTGEDLPSVEVELVDSPPPDATSPDDLATHEPDAARPGAAFEPRREDRRVAQRYRAGEGRCWVGWNDEGRFRQVAAWIIDISVSGSLIAVDVPPPTDRSVWIRLDDPAVPEWAEARVLDT